MGRCGRKGGVEVEEWRTVRHEECRYSDGGRSSNRAMIPIQHDTKGQPYTEWEQAPGIRKRAWIQRRDGEKDWAHHSRRQISETLYALTKLLQEILTDFPVFSQLPGQQVLEAFVGAVCAVTACPLP